MPDELAGLLARSSGRPRGWCGLRSVASQAGGQAVRVIVLVLEGEVGGHRRRPLRKGQYAAANRGLAFPGLGMSHGRDGWLSLDDPGEYDFMACRWPVLSEDPVRGPPPSAAAAATAATA